MNFVLSLPESVTRRHGFIGAAALYTAVVFCQAAMACTENSSPWNDACSESGPDGYHVGWVLNGAGMTGEVYPSAMEGAHVHLRQFYDPNNQEHRLWPPVYKDTITSFGETKQRWSVLDPSPGGSNGPPDFANTEVFVPAYRCPAGYRIAEQFNGTQYAMYDTPYYRQDNGEVWQCRRLPSSPERAEPGKSSGKPELCKGNPCDPLSGNKYQAEVDYRATGPMPLTFVRTYNSLAIPPAVENYTGANWLHNYQRRIVVPPSGKSTTVLLVRPDGRFFLFEDMGGNWSADADVRFFLAETPSGWQVTAPDGSIEVYSPDGRLLSIDDGRGNYQTLTYVQRSGDFVDDTLFDLHKVADRWGREIVFNVDSSSEAPSFAIDSITLPALPGETPREIDIAYKLTDKKMVPKTITYPDGKTRVYSFWWQDPHEHFIKTITDENGNLFSEFEYDGEGRVSKSLHKSGTADVNEISFVHHGDGTLTITDEKLESRTYSFDVINNTPRFTANTGGNCSHCSEGEDATYDTNGFIASSTAHDGNITYYKHDPDGRETCRLDGIVGTSATDDAAFRLVTRTWPVGYAPEPILVTTWEPVDQAAMAVPTSCDDTPDTNVWRKRHEREIAYMAGTFFVDWAEERSYPADPDDPARRTDFVYYGEDPNDPAILDGLIKAIDGPRDNVNDTDDTTTFDYHETTTADHFTGDLKKITGPEGNATEFPRYNADGQPLEILQPNGATMILAYSARGRLESTSVNNVATTFDYDGVGNLTRVTDAEDNYIRYEYDHAHRLTDIYSGAVVNGADLDRDHVAYTLDDLGNRTTETTTEAGSATAKRLLTRAMNVRDQVESLTDGNTGTLTFHYDDEGNIEKIADPRDAAPLSPTIFTENGFDARGNVTSNKPPENSAATATELRHDVFGNVVYVKDPNGVETEYTYNGFGDLRTLKSRDAGYDEQTPGYKLLQYKYDEAGNRISYTDARNIETRYVYDGANRLTGIDYGYLGGAVAADEQFFHDKDDQGNTVAFGGGELISVIDDSGETTFGYDARGNVAGKTFVSTSAAIGTLSTAYGHDDADRLASVTYPSGLIVRYYRTIGPGNDPDDSIRRITYDTGGGETNLVTDIDYEPFGPVSYMAHANGLETTRTYGLDYRPTRITVEASPGTDVRMNLSFSYDAAGNATRIDDELELYTDENDFGYDFNSRLTGITSYPDGAETTDLQYDANGNLTWLEFVPADSSGTYDKDVEEYFYIAGSNRIDEFSTPAQYWGSAYADTDFSFDAAGNVTLRDRAATDFTYTYGDNGRMATVTSSSPSCLWFPHACYTYEYIYNAFGQRVSRRDTSDTDPNRIFIYNETGLLIAVHGTAGPLKEYIYLDDEPVAFLDYPNTNGGGTPALYHIHTDQVRTPTITTDSGGATVGWRFGHRHYEYKHSGSVDHRLAFPGQYREDDGTYYNYFRDYDPETGRYLQSDPVGLEGGLNTFSYAVSNPLRYVDPFGLYAWPAVGIVDHIANVGLGALAGIASGSGTQGLSPSVSDIAEGMDEHPSEDPAACPSDDCAEIYQQIKDKLRELHSRYYAQCRNRRNRPKTHYTQYENQRKFLSRLVNEAIRKRCPIPPEAWDWLQTECPEPGTNAKENPPPRY